MKKILALLMFLILLIGCGMGGLAAWAFSPEEPGFNPQGD